jgi:hypothetical protein
MIREVTKALVKAGRGAVAISRSLGTSFKKFVLREKRKCSL